MHRILFALALAGCALAEVDVAETAEAPLAGAAGSSDAADRSCTVVLRDLGRNWTGFGYETVGDSWVWQGTVEISAAAAAAGLVPKAIYQAGSDPTWRQVTATPVSAPATPGYVRFTVRMFEGLPGPSTPGDQLAAMTIQMVPFVPQAGGGRLFDHNGNTSALANYEMTSPDFAIWAAPTICTPPSGPTRATLIFATDWSERRDGVLAPGGEMTISYDAARLPTCRDSQGGIPRYDITAHVRFEPDGERRDVSVRDTAPTIAVSATARRLVVWFENTSASGCQAWDSNFGANYTFDAMVPPQWMGNVKNLLVRDAPDPCASGSAASSGFNFDTYVRQRAGITNLCFEVYQPGTTDRDDPDLWKKLDVKIQWRIAGQPFFQPTYVSLDRRVGNNARYRLSWRDLDPFRPFHCPEVPPAPTPDGMHATLTLEYVIQVNGGEIRPAPGGAFAGTFVDYISDPWRTENCP